jgi:hypothetical protein
MKEAAEALVREFQKARTAGFPLFFPAGGLGFGA